MVTPFSIQALHLLAAMWDGGPTLTPDSVSYNTVLKACANAFQLARAVDVYKEVIGLCFFLVINFDDVSLKREFGQFLKCDDIRQHSTT